MRAAVRAAGARLQEAATAREATPEAAKAPPRVARSLEPAALVVPTAEELRLLFVERAAGGEMAASGNAEAIDHAYEKCRQVTEEYSKTFYLGSQMLDRHEQRAVWAIYNWCRSTDELVDGHAAAHTTMADLEAWEGRLDRVFELATGPLDNCTSWEDLALADSIRRFSLIKKPFEEMIDGMAMDLVKTRYEDFQELEVYCYRVAGTVGLMTLPILGFNTRQNRTEHRQTETIAAALALGVALQLTNILRDVGEDGRRGRIYLPREDLRRFEITEEELLETCHSDGFLFKGQRWRDFMEFQLARCHKFYIASEVGIPGLSEVNRLGVMAARYVYGEILEAVRRNNYDNFSRRAFVPLHEKALLLGKAWWRVQELKSVANDDTPSGDLVRRDTVAWFA